MAVDNPTSKIVVVDTEIYAGNFERELCAYVTGAIGECGVGGEVARAAASEIVHIDWWRRHVRSEADDKGCRRPTSIWATPGWFNNGMGGNYRDVPENYAPARDAAVRSMIEHQRHQEDIIRKRLETGDFEESMGGRGWTEEACRRTLADNAASVDRIRNSERRYPSYQSVAIFVDEFPEGDVLSEMKSRAETYCRDVKSISPHGYMRLDKIVLTGFRFVEPVRTTVERSV